MHPDKGFTITTEIALRRSDYAIEGELPDAILKRVFFASYDLEHRFEQDRIRPHTLTVSFIEVSSNIEDLSNIALGITTLKELTLVTKTKSQRIVSRRTFSNLRLRLNNASYAMHGDAEVPLQRFVFDCYLSNAEFPKI